MLEKINQKIINSELVLWKVDISDYENKLFVITSQAKSMKELTNQYLLIKYLSSIRFKEFADEKSVARVVQVVKLLSSVDCYVGLLSKEKERIHEEEALRRFVKLSAKQLAENAQKDNEFYLNVCCHACRKDSRKIRLEKNLESIDRFFLCPNHDCINFGLIKD